MNNKSINIIFIFFLINLFVNYTTTTTTSTTTIYVSNLNPKTYEGTNCGDSINTPCVNLNDACTLVSQKNNSIIEIEILNNNKLNNKEYKPTSKLEIVNENLSFSINGGLESTIIDITDFQDSFINIIKTNVTTTTESTINNNNNNNNNKFNFTNLTFKRNLNFSLPSSTKIRPTLFNIVNIKNLLFNNIEIILNNNTINDGSDYHHTDDDDEYHDDNEIIIQETAFFNFTNSNVKFSDCSIPSYKPIIGKDSTIEINFSNFTLDPNNLNSCYPCQYKINQSIDIVNNNNNKNDNNNNNNNNNNNKQQHKNSNSEYKENLIILSITISFSIIIVITATYKLYNKYRLYKTVNLSKSNNNNNNNNNTSTKTTSGGSGGGINLLKNIISKKTNSDYIKLEAIKSGDNVISINSE
ncbi:hypothetical protein DDB_G0275273 [Dictyostelium discoideum AX4]|uniref:Uncharacterized protein n=1 Tax=Dictyostelium discoideum TaxID=44689 RepID=Q554B5_DICDI|nr:hypothetical protein DDB_G0275273 [Dictyostelium discoideum AX4]EAL69917.1 hypothetical protein DDB_G0275273 [Dictyostelium discoideum AX4]|eukprot:XP_643796.1 hypothetical protein DDB_G0275273 [Dictyostelium discoideum AX4]